MINFELIEKIVPEDDEICNIYAIYGRDIKGDPHFLVVGGADNGQAPVIDISVPDHKARIYDEKDSVIDITEDFGLVSDIKSFDEAENFYLTLDF